jgi:eukaryotic-like serine/threonine-protein kinase
MNQVKNCPECGEPILGDAPRGFCPACLVRVGAGWDLDQKAEAEAGGQRAEDGRQNRSLLGGDGTRGQAEGGKGRGDQGLSLFGDNGLPLLFGGYELLEQIGHGGMGVVYRARQLAVNRLVALKMLLHGRFSEPAFVERFHIEAEAAAHLDHPNIVPIYEIGQHEGQPFYSMKLIEGRSLDRVSADCRVGASAYARSSAEWARRAVELLTPIARAVQYAHEHGVLHRDLKPHNILLDAEGQPHLTDFGLAKLLSQESSLTLSAAIIGSPGFMAPEQAAGKSREVTTAADIYGLGAVLYVLLTGKPLFQADTPLETVRKVIEQEPARPRLLNPAVDRDLETICLKCLQKEPGKRFASARALAEDLEHWLAAEPILARRTTPPERVWLWCRRQPVRAGLVGALILVFALGVTGVLWQWRRAVAGELFARQSAYAADMNRAQRELAADNLSLAVRLLDQYRPEHQRGIDLRDWEWRHLWQLCQPEASIELEHSRGPKREVAISSDGRLLCAQTGTNTARLWDLETKQRRGEVHTSAPILLLRLSESGSWLAVGTSNAIEVWETKVPRCASRLPQTWQLRSMAFSPDATLIAVYVYKENDERVELLDWKRNQPRAYYKTVLSRHYAGEVAFSPDGVRLAVGQDYGRIDVLEAKTLEVITSLTNLTVGGAGVTSLVFSPASDLLAAGYGDGSIHLWHVNSAKSWRELFAKNGTVKALTFSRDGSQLAGAGYGGAIRTWTVADRVEHRSFRGHAREGYGALAFLPNGKTLVSGCNVGTACFWDLTAPKHSLTHDELEISFGVAGQASIPRARFDPSNPKVVRRWGFAFVDEGRRFISTDPEGVLGIWDTRSIERKATLSELGSNYWGVALSPDSQWLAAGDASGKIHVWDWRSQPHRLLKTFDIPFQWFGYLQFSRSGRYLRAMTGFNDRTTRFRIWRTEDWQEVPLGAFELASSWTADLSPDDRYLVSGYRDGSVKLWAFPSGKHFITTTKHSSSVWTTLFSPDGRLLATTSWDGTVRLWSVPTLRELAVLQGHSGLVYGAAFSPDGARLATGGMDSTEAVRLWHIATRRELLTLQGAGDLFARVVFSPDGNTLMATSFAGIANLWHAPSSEKILDVEQQQERSKTWLSDMK